MSNTVDPAQKAAMIAMAKAGHTGPEISAAFGYTNKRSAGVALRRWGITMADNEKSRNAAKRAEIIRLHRDGKSRNEIWHAGVADIKTIRAVLADAGIVGQKKHSAPKPAPIEKVKIRAVPKVLPVIALRKQTVAKGALGFSQDAINRYLANARQKMIAGHALSGRGAQ